MCTQLYSFSDSILIYFAGVCLELRGQIWEHAMLECDCNCKHKTKQAGGAVVLTSVGSTSQHLQPQTIDVTAMDNSTSKQSSTVRSKDHSKRLSHSVSVSYAGGFTVGEFLGDESNSGIEAQLNNNSEGDEFNINGDFVESQAFGYLAIRSFLNLPISFPNTTRCKKP